jgi:hypothetical protein
MGSSTYATAMVLTVFMGGLALGSYAGGKTIDRARRIFFWARCAPVSKL